MEFMGKQNLVEVNEQAVETFVGNLRGSAITHESLEYDEARRIWNGMIDRRPAMIVRSAGVSDVIAAVNFARENDLLLSVKGGGHNVSGNAVCDRGLMIDLSYMRSVRVDPRAGRARVDGGATWGDFDAGTQVFGLATAGGLISATGVAGLTLGGGIGWLSPSYGLACDNLVSADVVTADGKVVTASDDENPDLFWGLKGGGGNFGITTSFEFKVYPVGPNLFGGMIVHSLEEAQAALENFVEFMKNAPDQLGAVAGFITTPDGTPAIALIGVFNGPTDVGEKALESVRRFGNPILDTFGVAPYRKIQALFDDGVSAGLRYYWKSSFLDRLPREALGIVIDQARSRPSSQTKIFLEFLGGALARIPGESAVFDHRASRYNYLIVGQWENAEEDEVNRQWARESWQAMDPYASEGVYVNYLGTESDEEGNRVKAAYGPGKFEKLLALKRKYDPTNLFCMNQNIRPDIT